MKISKRNIEVPGFKRDSKKKNGAGFCVGIETGMNEVDPLNSAIIPI